MLPILYVDWLSTGDFGPAPRDQFGKDASGLSANSIQRLSEASQAEHKWLCCRELRFHGYAYWFVDGIHASVWPGENDRLGLLVVIGVREDENQGATCGRGRLPGVDRVVGARS